ncbi:DUF3566 domain-containing protein [Streptomyces sp. CMB-StM0423]|uniref:DUF3566 domain-containing protein n=1 Tax=Streptomyces sp. CMB-StM0423 TaxID=2059884 RepID=UPI000C711CDD|nr:DUF3566 domain-containing protein [Streptomyces sp. CMB-StM0423]AUH41860.1 hypothetical protein CXR04_18055 [Streptomyces sp. CMB-StM0423]
MSGATGAGAGPARAEGYAQPNPPPGPDDAGGGHGGRRGRRRGASAAAGVGGAEDPQAHAYPYDGAPEGPMPPPTAAPGAPPAPHHPPQAYTPPAGVAGGGHAGGRTAGRGGQAYEQAQQTAAGVRRSRTGASTVPRTRKARLRIAKADPWSVMKVSFLLSIALGICTIVAVTVLWMVLDAMGVFSTVGGTISEATGSDDSAGFDLESFLSLPRVAGFTAVVALIDVVLATALATLGAFIYNLSAGFVGGIEVTLAEDE